MSIAERATPSNSSAERAELMRPILGRGERTARALGLRQLMQNKAISKLSGGEQQRLSIIRAPSLP